MNELFEFYFKKYRVEQASLEEKIFYLYFNDDKYRLCVDDDIVYLEKYSRLFKDWVIKSHAHPDSKRDVKYLINYFINKKTR